MKKLIALGALLIATSLFSSGCAVTHVIHPARPTTTVVIDAAPARVYHNGQWLTYRTDGYYLWTPERWVVASSVPNDVVRYHRVRPTGATTARHHYRHTHHGRTYTQQSIIRETRRRPVPTRATVSPRKASPTFELGAKAV